jgi:hypothetical protein
MYHIHPRLLSPRHCIIPSWLRARGRVQELNAESVLKKTCLVRCRSLSCLSPSWVGSHRPHTTARVRSAHRPHVATVHRPDSARGTAVSLWRGVGCPSGGIFTYLLTRHGRDRTRPGHASRHARSRTRPGHSAAPPGPRAHRETARARSALGLEPGVGTRRGVLLLAPCLDPHLSLSEALSPSLRACAAHRCGRARRGALDPRPRPRLRPRSAPAFRNTVVANPREARVKGMHTWLRENAKRKGAA